MVVENGISWEIDDGIGRITFCCPEKANTLTYPAACCLAKAMVFMVTHRPRVLLLSARGAIFCAGGDINEFLAAGSELPALVDRILTLVHPALEQLGRATFPIVSSVSGPIGGAGIGLALCADFVLGAESMKLRTGYAAIGLAPDLGTSYFLAKRIGAIRAKHWLMLSDTIDAQTCLAAGAVDALYPDAELASATELLLRRLASAATGSMTAIRALCDGAEGASLGEHLAREHAWLRQCAQSADSYEGIRAYLERRPANYFVPTI